MIRADAWSCLGLALAANLHLGNQEQLEEEPEKGIPITPDPLEAGQYDGIDGFVASMCKFCRLAR